MIKKLLIILLASTLSSLGTFAAMNTSCAETSTRNDKIALYNKVTPIEDELIKSKEFPKLMPVFERDTSPITDELMETVAPSGRIIKLWAVKKGEAKTDIIEDELINSKFKTKFGTVSVLKVKQKNIIEDNFAKNNIKLVDRTFAKAKNDYDFSKKQIPVQLKVIKNLTTKNNILEGDSILFKTVKDVTINGELFPKGTNIVGRVETISASDKMGTPANIIIDNFYVKEKPDVCFSGSISKAGANRSLWVYPLYQAGNIMLYVAGFAFVPIHGGHAKLLTSETYTVFYETH